MSRPQLVLVTPSRSVPAALWQAVRAHAHRLAVDSQDGARRNAMVANSALAARRAEREDVEEFFAALEQQRRQAQADRTGVATS